MTPNTRLAINAALLAVSMLGLAYASVPLYRLFCQVTGFGGTTQEAIALPDKILDRTITVRFNADIDSELPWKFAAGEREVKVKIGEQRLTHYVAENKENTPVTGHATYNVVPHQAGAYFFKISCFCFENQTLGAKQKVNMPVSFFIDPAIMDDPEMKDLNTITLSYTFFPKKD